MRECRFWERVLDKVEPRLECDVRNDPYSLFLGFIRARDVIDHSQQTRLAMLKRAVVVGYTYALRRLGWPVPKMPFHDFAAMAGNKAAFFEAVAEVDGTQATVDSSKFYLDAIELYRLFPARTRVILLTREGRAVYYSGLKRGESRERAVRTWRRTYERALPLLERHIPMDARLHVRYEDLAQYPENTLKRVCEFIGIDYESGMLNFGSKPHHITNGNNMRFASNQSIRFDNTWKTNLSEEALSYFEVHAGELNRRLGYT